MSGSFRDNASYWADAQYESEYHQFLFGLGRRLQRENITPKLAAEMLRDSKRYVEGEEVLAVWERLGDRHEHWPLAHTSTAAGEFLKRCACGRKP